ncbi:rRNA N-glycosidase [Rhynchospora pubera]|uniref:rRNA N-glycosylase n=1 Tax=Rhynchospora pubera TaxID=906938 RepID=A0AAV8H712_9POAL|nr:rRNA N-glycosidase [Rhynchospora pubera]
MAPKRKNSDKPSSSVAKTINVKRLSFKVKKKSGYKGYVNSLRSEFFIPSRIKHGIHVLPEEKPPENPEEFIEACLQTDESGVVLLIRKDNVYLVGFKSEEAEKYYSFDDHKKKSIPDFLPSTKLDFSGNYPDLVSPLSSLSFNEHTIVNAIKYLAKYKCRVEKNDGEHEKVGDSEAKKHIACLIVIICEAIRMENVLSFISTQMRSVQSRNLGSVNLDEEVRQWATSSRKVLDNFEPPSEEQIDIFRSNLQLLKPVKPCPGLERYMFPPPEPEDKPVQDRKMKSK